MLDRFFRCETCRIACLPPDLASAGNEWVGTLTVRVLSKAKPVALLFFIRLQRMNPCREIVQMLEEGRGLCMNPWEDLE